MASVTKRGDGWQVKWRDPDGKQRGRKCPSRQDAERLRRQVESCVAAGRRWTPQDADPIPRLRSLVVAYMDERRLALRPHTVQRISTMLDQFIEHVDPRGDTTIDELSKPTLAEFYRHLTSRKREVVRWTDADGKAQAKMRRPLSTTSARDYLREVETFWEWAYDNDETENEHVPRPRRLEIRIDEHAADVVAPTWEEMDRCIAASKRWGRRLAVVLRFTGLRVAQALHLEWRDIDFAKRTLTIRPNLPGSKTPAERKGRVVPVSRHLLAELAGWGVREGFLIDASASSRRRPDSASRAMAKAWARAGVRREVWAADGLRRKGRADHCFRDGFQSNLKEMGADDEAVKRLVGHKLEGARDHYIDPNSLPMRAAVDMIPPLSVESNVRQFAREG